MTLLYRLGGLLLITITYIDKEISIILLTFTNGQIPWLSIFHYFTFHYRIVLVILERE